MADVSAAVYGGILEYWNGPIRDKKNPPEYAVDSKDITLHAVDLTPRVSFHRV